MGRAWYEAQLSRAFPNASQHELDWGISLVRGYARIHAASILHEEPVIWPDPRLSEAGRHMLQVRDLAHKIRTEGLQCDL